VCIALLLRKAQPNGDFPSSLHVGPVTAVGTLVTVAG
jgi:hypothetical protein